MAYVTGFLAPMWETCLLASSCSTPGPVPVLVTVRLGSEAVGGNSVLLSFSDAFLKH